MSDTKWVVDWGSVLFTPVVAAMIGFGVWWIQSRIDQLQRAHERLHDERRKVYADILEPYVLLFAQSTDQAAQQKALQIITSVEYKRQAFEFSLIGSDDVVGAFNDMMQLFYKAEASGEKLEGAEILDHWGRFLLAIRKSIGNPKTNLTGRDMLRGLLKGIDDIPPSNTEG